MQRANRHYQPGYVWHLTHRCHRRQFLLTFACDRAAWENWLFDARRRVGLSVFNYTVTCNHIHLLVRDRGDGEIAASMQLIAGRTGHGYNHRTCRHGACWQDRYHATAVETGIHLSRCLTYTDLNLVRAGVVAHPRDWPAGGYHEIQQPRARKRIIDRAALAKALELGSVAELAATHRAWVEAALQQRPRQREAKWSETLAVGSRSFIEQVRRDLGGAARHRDIVQDDDAFLLREPAAAYLPISRPQRSD